MRLISEASDGMSTVLSPGDARWASYQRRWRSRQKRVHRSWALSDTLDSEILAGITMIAFTFALLWRQSREISQAPRAPSDVQISSNRSDCSNKLNLGEREWNFVAEYCEFEFMMVFWLSVNIHYADTYFKVFVFSIFSSFFLPISSLPVSSESRWRSQCREIHLKRFVETCDIVTLRDTNNNYNNIIRRLWHFQEDKSRWPHFNSILSRDTL